MPVSTKCTLWVFDVSARIFSIATDTTPTITTTMNAEHNYIEDSIDQECPQNWPPATSTTNSNLLCFPFPCAISWVVILFFVNKNSNQNEIKRIELYNQFHPPLFFSPCIKLLFPLCILLSTYHYPVFLIFLSRVVLNLTITSLIHPSSIIRPSSPALILSQYDQADCSILTLPSLKK